jgi:hypothetical protein
VCLSCTATGERVCLAAEGFGNRHCFLENIADKVSVMFILHKYNIDMGSYFLLNRVPRCWLAVSVKSRNLSEINVSPYFYLLKARFVFIKFVSVSPQGNESKESY